VSLKNSNNEDFGMAQVYTFNTENSAWELNALPIQGLVDKIEKVKLSGDGRSLFTLGGNNSRYVYENEEWQFANSIGINKNCFEKMYKLKQHCPAPSSPNAKTETLEYNVIGNGTEEFVYRVVFDPYGYQDRLEIYYLDPDNQTEVSLLDTGYILGTSPSLVSCNEAGDGAFVRTITKPANINKLYVRLTGNNGTVNLTGLYLSITPMYTSCSEILTDVAVNYDGTKYITSGSELGGVAQIYEIVEASVLVTQGDDAIITQDGDLIGMNTFSIQFLSQPTDQNIRSGGATFEASVVDTYGDITYQWQTNDATLGWTNIQGETNPTLSLTGLTSSDVGNEYRVIASSVIGGVDGTSDTVTLLVEVTTTTSTTPDPTTSTTPCPTCSMSIDIENNMDNVYLTTSTSEHSTKFRKNDAIGNLPVYLTASSCVDGTETKTIYWYTENNTAFYSNVPIAVFVSGETVTLTTVQDTATSGRIVVSWNYTGCSGSQSSAYRIDNNPVAATTTTSAPTTTTTCPPTSMPVCAPGSVFVTTYDENGCPSYSCETTTTTSSPTTTTTIAPV
jgi:hypothetical protein